MKKIFENAVWWSGVIMVGLVLGLTIQFVKAWTEPSQAPPSGNLGAPINTGPIGQFKQGVLQVLGLTVYNDPAVGGDVTGKVLTAQNANGAAGWAAGGGSVSFTYFCFTHGTTFGSPPCTDHGGTQGFCPSAGEPGSGGLSGLKQKAALGSWGSCNNTTYRGGIGYDYPFMPGGTCGDQSEGHYTSVGNAYVCSQ